jgi:hypothetical protein
VSKNRRNQHPPKKRPARVEGEHPHGAGEDEPLPDSDDGDEDENEQAGKEAYGNVVLADAPEQEALQLQHVASATVAVGQGGTGYALNDTVTLPDGVVLKATTMTGSKIASVSVQAAGSADINTIPANPVAQVSTSGAGTGAKFNLTWTAGPPPIGATAPPTFPPTVGTAPVPVPPGSMAPIVISPAAVPPSVAGVAPPTYGSGNATTPANLFPGHFSTTPPYPPIVISATFNNVAVDAGKTPPWKIVQPPTTPTVAILLKPDSDDDDEAGDAGTVHNRHAEPAERRRRSVLQRADARQEH